MTTSNRDNLQEQIIDRAWNDENFRQALLNDPKTALEQELGMSLGADLRVQVVEEPQDSLVLVLPVRPDAELTLQELDLVTGGSSNTTTTFGTTTETFSCTSQVTIVIDGIFIDGGCA